MGPGSNMTFKCKRPEHDALIPQEWTYLLLKEGDPQPLQNQTTPSSWAYFSLLFVTTQDSGNYSCKYFGSKNPQRESEASTTLEIWEKGSLPKPTFSAETALIMATGSNMTFECKRQDNDALVPQLWTYLLLKEGNARPLQKQVTIRSWAYFTLQFVTTQDSGNYSCKYFGSKNPQRESEASTALVIRVKGPLPKPLLSVETVLIMAPGSNLTLKCKRPENDALIPQQWTYLLLKEGNPQPLQKQITSSSWVYFSLLIVTAQDSGNYSCKYFGSQNQKREPEASSALDIRVKDSIQTAYTVINLTRIILAALILAVTVMLLNNDCHSPRS
ncbi:immunoglobulin superfamily member 1-like [Gracilinanus agilis]|uniref:immunoglobulin superfamily member 1-like n=1 Tax=Gracilinanus agilis TaxID=191870 RepID=UPI001CFDD8FF|nr:immunoglobulin superfamily member 1-like [Gracilinanus agilis]